MFSEVNVTGIPEYGVYGEYFLRVDRILVNPENPKDEKYVRDSGLRAIDGHFRARLGNIEVETLEGVIYFQTGDNLADFKGKFKITKKSRKSDNLDLALCWEGCHQGSKNV
ncbi:MAG: hypothetical protein AABW58_01415 [Nanoarchaeota archaeon]